MPGLASAGRLLSQLNLNPAVGRVLALETLDEANTCAHDGFHLMGQALHRRRSAASDLWRCCSHPPDRHSGVHSCLDQDLLRQPLGRAELPDLGSISATEKRARTGASRPAPKTDEISFTIC